MATGVELVSEGSLGSVRGLRSEPSPRPPFALWCVCYLAPLPTFGRALNKESQSSHQPVSRPCCWRRWNSLLRSVPGRYWEKPWVQQRDESQVAPPLPPAALGTLATMSRTAGPERKTDFQHLATNPFHHRAISKQSKDRDRMPWDIHIDRQWNYIC